MQENDRDKAPRSGIGRRREAARLDSNEEYRTRRRDLIRAGAMVFKEKGYEAATLHDVAERLGADRASLYYYVSGKQELFQEAVREEVEANLAELERILARDDGPEEKLRLIIRQLVCSYEEHYPQMYVYIQEDMRRVASDSSPWAKQMMLATRRFESITLALIQQVIEQEGFRSDVPPMLAMNALFGMMNWTHRWFKPGNRLTAVEIVDTFWAIFVDGMRVERLNAASRAD
jgi:TetR/AcrR family transcriptional regulator, cholesterol catabolism regulator